MDLKRLRYLNWLEIIKEKSERIANEHKNDIDYFVKIANGEFKMLAQQEFCFEKAQGLYDSMNVRVPEYDY